MSYNIDGKIVNQPVESNMSKKVRCSKCSKLLQNPSPSVVDNVLTTNQVFNCFSYIGTDYFVYETKRGIAVVYCSDYCRKKHNHRFNQGA